MTKQAAGQTKRRKPARRLIGGGMLVLVALLLIGGGVLWSFTGQAVSAPDFLRLRVESRIADALPGLRLRFGDLQATVETDGATRVALRDVDVTTRNGTPVAQLSDLDLDIAPWPLLRGEVAVTRAHLSGAVLTVSRTHDGKVSLAFGEMAGATDTPPDLPRLIAGLGDVFNDPALSRLERIEADAITLRYEDARAGRGWTVDSGRLRVSRVAEAVTLSGDLALLNGGADVTRIEVNADAVLGERGLRFGMRFDNMRSGDIATQAPALAWLDALRAPISGALRSEMLDDGSLGALNATLQIGAGVLQPNSQTRPIPFTGARTYFTYTPQDQVIAFSEVAVDSALGRAQAEGRAYLRDVTDGWPERMVAQFTLHDIETSAQGLFETPLTIERAEMDLSLHLDPFRLTLGRLRVDDPDLPVRLKGQLDATPDGWDLALDGRTPNATPSAIKAHWPPSFVPKTRRWFSENVLGGDLRNLRFALRASPGQKPITHLALDFDKLSLRYARILPLLEDGSGQLSLLNNRLVVTAQRGHVTAKQGGRLDIAGTHFVIPDVRQRPATGAVDLHATGPITALLSVLDSEKMTLMQKSGLPVDLAQGQVAAHGQLILPLKKGNTPKDIAYAFEGTLRNVETSRLIPNRTITADRLSVTADNTRLEIAGAGRFDGVPFDGRWAQPLGQGPGTPSSLSAQVQLSQTFADRFGIALPPGSLSGQAQAQLSVDGIARGRAPGFTLASDLRGLGLSLPAIGWRKGQSGTGTLEVAGTLGKVPEISRLRLAAAGLSADGTVRLRPDRTLDRIAFDRVQVGEWLDAPVVLRGRGKGAPLGVTLTGGRLDMRGLPKAGGAGAGGAGAGGGGPLSVALDRLTVSDGVFLTRMVGDFDTARGLQGSFTASLKGEAPITGELVPQPSGGSAIRLRSDRADKVVMALGLLKKAQGGDLSVTLRPTGAPGTYDGQARITDIRMRDAPAVASLLDGMSIVGLLDQLGGPGIAFAEVDARFRVRPGQVIVTQSSAVGPSMGLSLDGYYDTQAGTLDMQGVLSPIYLLNGIGQIFTRKGEGLIGFNFELSGPAKSPRVLVNPLSVLTPGMFREIFRRPPPEVTQ